MIRQVYIELYRLYHDRLYFGCLVASILLGFFFPFLYMNNLDNAIVRLFGAPGYIYTMLCSMAVVCIFVGKDFVYRTFQNKLANGGSRIVMMTANYIATNIAIIPVVAIFPLCCVCSTKMLAGWNTEHGAAFARLIQDQRFWFSYAAFLIGIISVISICYILTIIYQDFGKSIGVSTAFIVVSVMLAQKIHDLEALRFIRPLAEITPLYQMIANIRQASILASDFILLVLSSVITICLSYGVSCFVIKRAKLK